MRIKLRNWALDSGLVQGKTVYFSGIKGIISILKIRKAPLNSLMETFNRYLKPSKATGKVNSNSTANNTSDSESPLRKKSLRNGHKSKRANGVKKKEDLESSLYEQWSKRNRSKSKHRAVCFILIYSFII